MGIFIRSVSEPNSLVFVDWANKEITNYADMFRKQVYTSDADPKVIEEAKKMTYAQSKRVNLLWSWSSLPLNFSEVMSPFAPLTVRQG